MIISNSLHIIYIDVYSKYESGRNIIAKFSSRFREYEATMKLRKSECLRFFLPEVFTLNDYLYPFKNALKTQITKKLIVDN